MNNTCNAPFAERKALNKTVAWGFVVRLVLLIFILSIGTWFTEPYFISDDIKYEETAQNYLENAEQIFDSQQIDNIWNSYLSPLWPVVISLAAYVFRTIYIGRFINIVLSTVCIYLIYNLTKEISSDHATALRSARLFAFMPITVITCCFPIKDILLTLGVLYVFYIFVRIQLAKKVNWGQCVLCIILLLVIYYTRGAVTEMLLLFLAVHFLIRLAKQKKYVLLVLSAIVVLVLIYLFRDNIITAFGEKTEDYGTDTGLGNGIRLVQINGIMDIYKLPFTYFFANLQPVTLDLFTFSIENFWSKLLTLLNISIYPIAIGNIIYIFVKKHNFYFWLSTFIMYASVIILSLGVFRHYLFLMPMQLINFSLCVERKPNTKNIITVGSICLFLFVLVVSVLRNI